MLRFVQWARTFGLHSAAGSWKIGDLSDPATKLGQSPLRSPSVFNFFRPGYVPPSTALARSEATAPEFQLVNETSVGGYLNFMQSVIRQRLYVSAPISGRRQQREQRLRHRARLHGRTRLGGRRQSAGRPPEPQLSAGQLSDATCQLIDGRAERDADHRRQQRERASSTAWRPRCCW